MSTWRDNLTVETMNKERANPPFDIEAMAVANHGGAHNLQIKRNVQLEVERDPTFFNDDIYDLTKAELRERTYIKMPYLFNWLSNENLNDFQSRLAVVATVDPGFWTRFGVHLGLFTNAIRSGATANQFNYWIQQGMLSARSFYGCFGMTELAHGSNVAGVETTATFDENTDEFIIHTPNLGATKWWIGGAAHSATHCAVFAQLIVKGKSYGTKTFIVPLRDTRTFGLLPGVNIGDIGKKMGRDGIDNGYIQFTNVRIPRAFMLMRYTQVTREGEVFEPPLAQLTYGALLTGRTMMVADSSNSAKKALTIALRYAAVRRQFKSDPKNEFETQLLDYPIHQRRLIPLLAQAVGFGFVGYELNRMLNETNEKIESLEPGDEELEATIELLKATHASSAGLKAFCTWATLETIETCRQSLGGHGYSSYAGLANLGQDFAVHCTWEGDNTILALQSGRALIAAYLEIKSGKKQGPALNYLNNLEQSLSAKCKSTDELLTFEGIKTAFANASAHAVKRAGEMYEGLMKSGVNRETAYEQCSHSRFVAASIHTSGFIFNQFVSAVEHEKESDNGVKKALATLCTLYGLWQIEEKASFFFRGGYLSPDQLDFVSETVTRLCAEVRTFAIPLVDSFMFSDFVINSPFGRYDGNVYREYMAMIQRNNPQTRPHPYLEKLVKPLLHRPPNLESTHEQIDIDEEIAEILEERKAEGTA
ncbi:acyl-CoA oxidase [Malassezia cuniculi]|uniref:Acyl-coenzyme A oxidase n=1 Tax=Malassezia cuniculi TaxID=948313 RepID=A0AAF0ETY4_9BASI|nr:acyl-CoA oxidase [Malassezia cuniculi]